MQYALREDLLATHEERKRLAVYGQDLVGFRAAVFMHAPIPGRAARRRHAAFKDRAFLRGRHQMHRIRQPAERLALGPPPEIALVAVTRAKPDERGDRRDHLQLGQPADPVGDGVFETLARGAFADERVVPLEPAVGTLPREDRLDGRNRSRRA